MDDRPVLGIEVTVSDNVATICLSGELDLAGRDAGTEAFESLDAGVVVVDLVALTFIDSSGLSVLAFARKHCAERGARFEIQNVGPFVHRAFELSGLASLLESTVDNGGGESAQIPR